MSVEILHVSGSISGVGGAIEVNDIIIHILIFVDIFVVSGVTVGKFIRVVGDTVSITELNEVSSFLEMLFLVFDAVVEVLIDDIISWVTLVFKILVFVVISVGDVVTSSHATLGVLGDILLEMSLVNLDGVGQISIILHSDV